jgi:hypothetical protein
MNTKGNPGFTTKFNNFVYNLLTNYFFWIFLSTFFFPFVLNHVRQEGNPLTYLDYIVSVYLLIIDPLSHFIYIPNYIYNPYSSAFSYLRIFVSVIGITGISSLFLAISNFKISVLHEKVSLYKLSCLFFYIILLLSIIPYFFVSLLIVT